MKKTFTTTIAGREFTVETGEVAQLASGAAMVRYGDTVVLATATASAKPRDGVDFFPLSVDYEEKMYSVGKIPGGFLKREGKPSEKAILTSRVIDRPIRPLFPKDYRNDVGIVTTVMSVDIDNSPEVCAMNGASIAISISQMPFAGPVGAVVVGLVDGQYVINPTLEEREKSEMYVTVAGTKEKIVMIEAGANEIKEDVMFNAIVYAHEEIKKICDFIDTIVAEVGKEKEPYTAHEVDHDLYDKVYAFSYDKVCEAIETGKYDVVILNFANCDMVGHTGFFDAAVKAVETVDTCVGRVEDSVLKMGGVMLLTADHGNADRMIDVDGSPFTAHTTNPVPFSVIGKDCELREGGKLCDISPTIIKLLGLEQPAEMSGESIIK